MQHHKVEILLLAENQYSCESNQNYLSAIVVQLSFVPEWTFQPTRKKIVLTHV